MAIITIDDKEYEADNFTEDQQGMLREIKICSDEVNRAAYVNKVLDVRSRALVAALSQSLEDNDDDQTEMDV
tara:strand:- start:291 stop:506 length:216 start_codon:yes stop_codon:yes gene_type:complete